MLFDRGSFIMTHMRSTHPNDTLLRSIVNPMLFLHIDLLYKCGLAHGA